MDKVQMKSVDMTAQNAEKNATLFLIYMMTPVEERICY